MTLISKRNVRWGAVLVFVLGFAGGTLAATWQPAAAQQRFGREDVQSVPDSFLEGGDRVYTVLKDVAQSTKASAESLARMEKTAGDAEKRHRELMKRLDSLDTRLKRVHDAIVESQ